MARRHQRRWLDGWEAVAATGLRQWPLLDEAERRQLGTLVEWFLRRKRFEAARGFTLTQEVGVTVAAHAALLALGLGTDPLDDVRSIVVHARTITQRGPRTTTVRGVIADGPRRVLGHATDRRGPVVLSWAAIRADARRAGSGQNVILHELAHKLDAITGTFDGTPALDRDQQAEWVRVCTTEYRRLRRASVPDPVLRPYAATSPAEFFAVATEVFFERPLEMRSSRPRLYEVLGEYYRQDPAVRAERAA